MAKHWMQAARDRMEDKGSVGSFGAATPSKIAAGKKAGGVEKKKAVLADTFKKIAAKRKGNSGY